MTVLSESDGGWMMGYRYRRQDCGWVFSYLLLYFYKVALKILL